MNNNNNNNDSNSDNFTTSPTSPQIAYLGTNMPSIVTVTAITIIIHHHTLQLHQLISLPQKIRSRSFKLEDQIAEHPICPREPG